MRLVINNFSKYKRGTEQMFNKLLKVKDKATTADEYFALRKARDVFVSVIPNQAAVTKLMRSGVDPFVECWNNHPFKALGIGTTTNISGIQASDLICRAIKVREDYIVLPIYVNNSYSAVQFHWSTEEGWEVTWEMFKKRRDPDKFTEFFNNLTRYIEVDYYNTMDVQIEGRI